MITSSTPEIAALHARIHNLEVALHGMWAMLKDLQPPGTQEDVERLMVEHFNASSNAGAFSMPAMVG